jgi:hypothetical protein
MAFQNKYSSHVPHISPKSERRHGAIEQKKPSLPVGKRKKEQIESSIVSSLQSPNGDPRKIRSTAQGHILPKAQYMVCSPHSIALVLYPFSPPSLIIHFPMIGI